MESAPTQAPGIAPVSRFSWITGKFAITDFFDNNSYSHDPRTQFMNWSLMYNGAWDYPADVRGYTIGTLQELEMRNWAFRAGSVMEPTEANGPTLDTRVGRNLGLALEYEHRHTIMGRHGAIRVHLPRGPTPVGRCTYPGRHPAQWRRKVWLRPQYRTGTFPGCRSLWPVRLERRQNRKLGIHRNRSLS